MKARKLPYDPGHEVSLAQKSRSIHRLLEIGSQFFRQKTREGTEAHHLFIRRPELGLENNLLEIVNFLFQGYLHVFIEEKPSI